MLAYDFHLEQGAIQKADSYYARAERYYEKLQKFYDQATIISAADRFEAHGLSETEVENLRKQLRGVHGLGRTYVVRKMVDGATEPLYVIGAFATYTWRAGENEKHVDALVDELASNVQGLPNTIIISMDLHQYLAGKFEKIPGSVVLAGGDENVELRH